MTQDDKSFDGPSQGEAARSGGNVPEYSVSEISGGVKKALEERFGHVRVRGEVSGYRGPQASGHVYFSIKDQQARLDAVLWKGVFQKLKLLPQEGMEMIFTGKISSFPGSSKYQLVVSDLEPSGEGALMAMLERQKRLLAAEGLFDPERKKPLPYLPEVVGVVASPTGAVIRDILHRFADRFPRRVILWPAAAQGERCPPEVAAGIRGFNALPPGGPIPRPDVIIVARGGGSIEDLWGYNAAAVVRAAAESAIPLISAVGHETDVTLIDHAADRRAPTPTAAAEMAVPVRSELLAQLEDLDLRRRRAMRRLMEERRTSLRAAERALSRPGALLEAPRQRLDSAAASLPRALALWRARQERRFSQAKGGLEAARVRLSERRRGAKARLDTAQERLTTAPTRLIAAKRRRLNEAPLSPAPLKAMAGRGRERFAALSARLEAAPPARLGREAETLKGLGRLLESYSFKGVLARGFALVRDAEGRPLREASRVSPGDVLALTLQDGELRASALPPEDTAKPKTRARRAK